MARQLRQGTEDYETAFSSPAGGDNAENDTGADSSAGNSAGVHPPSETITDSTRIIGDSAIVRDTAPQIPVGQNGDTTLH